MISVLIMKSDAVPEWAVESGNGPFSSWTTADIAANPNTGLYFASLLCNGMLGYVLGKGIE